MQTSNKKESLTRFRTSYALLWKHAYESYAHIVTLNVTHTLGQVQAKVLCPKSNTNVYSLLYGQTQQTKITTFVVKNSCNSEMNPRSQVQPNQFTFFIDQTTTMKRSALDGCKDFFHINNQGVCLCICVYHVFEWVS